MVLPRGVPVATPKEEDEEEVFNIANSEFDANPVPNANVTGNTPPGPSGGEMHTETETLLAQTAPYHVGDEP